MKDLLKAALSETWSGEHPRLHSEKPALQYLMKNGRAAAAIPAAARSRLFEINQGIPHKISPERSATPRFCFLPYTMYPIPTEPRIRPRNNEVESI
jgi:hypothetical protein